MRILICGSRNWNDPQPIAEILDDHIGLLQEGQGLVLIHGGARGADSVAHAEAQRRQIPTITEKADWTRYGKGAGPVRNQLMLDKHAPDAVYAFRSTGRSTGTDDMIKRAKKAGVPTYVISTTYQMSEPTLDI